nr:MAG TPA: hypothetical protein [Caudoviricetes sp.]
MSIISYNNSYMPIFCVFSCFSWLPDCYRAYFSFITINFTNFISP